MFVSFPCLSFVPGVGSLDILYNSGSDNYSLRQGVTLQKFHITNDY